MYGVTEKCLVAWTSTMIGIIFLSKRLDFLYFCIFLFALHILTLDNKYMPT